MEATDRLSGGGGHDGHCCDVRQQRGRVAGGKGNVQNLQIGKEEHKFLTSHLCLLREAGA